MRGSKIAKLLSCGAIVLIVHIATWEISLTQETDPGEKNDLPETADTTAVEPDTTMLDSQPPEAEPLELNEDIFPYGELSDSLMLAGGRESRAIYREWWLWTVAVVVVSTTIILYAGGEEEAEEELPGFPEPPDR